MFVIPNGRSSSPRRRGPRDAARAARREAGALDSRLRGKDGYTLLFTQNSPLTTRRVLEPAASGYDPLRELTPLAITTRTPSLQKAARDPAIAARLLPLGIVQDWEPAARLSAEIRREYGTVADVAGRLQPKK